MAPLNATCGTSWPNPGGSALIGRTCGCLCGESACRLLHIAAALLLAAGCRFCARCRLLLCCSPPSAASALAAVCAVWPLLVLLSAAPPLFCCSPPPAASALVRCRLLYGCCRLLHRRCFAAHLPLPLLRSLPSADRRCLPPLSLLAAVCFTSPLLCCSLRSAEWPLLLLPAAARRFCCSLPSATHRRRSCCLPPHFHTSTASARESTVQRLSTPQGDGLFV
jgi:hypothetical protein